MERSAIVNCATCGIPGRVVFEGDKIVAAYFVCKCPRPSVEEANGEQIDMHKISGMSVEMLEHAIKYNQPKMVVDAIMEMLNNTEDRRLVLVIAPNEDGRAHSCEKCPRQVLELARKLQRERSDGRH